MGSSSLTRGLTWAPCSGSVESKPLDHQRNPTFIVIWQGNFRPHKFNNKKKPGLAFLHILFSRNSLLSYFIKASAAAVAKSLQSCLTLCDPIDGSPPGSTVPGILQARTLEWVAISFSNAWKWKVKSLSRVRLLEIPWTVAYQAPPSMGFSSQEYWSRVPLPPPKSIWETRKK